MKKLLYTLLFSFAFIGTYTAMAQTEKQPATEEKLTSGPEYDKHYQKLKELHIKELRSETHKKQNKLNKAFIEKMGFEGDPEEIQKDILGWVKKNIEKTTFKNYEAAEEEWQAILAIGMENMQENKEYFDYLMVSFDCCEGCFYRF